MVNATGTAVIPDDRALVQEGWLSLQLAPPPNFPGIPIEVNGITKPIRDAHHRIQGIGNMDPATKHVNWWMTLDAAIQMVESGRFLFYVLDGTIQVPIVVDVSPAGRKFLRTEFDNKATDNLEQLQEIPAQT